MIVNEEYVNRFRKAIELSGFFLLMQFDSFAFCVFLPLVFCIYWLLADKYKWVLLLVSSYYFYMSWNIEYSILIFLTTGVSWLTALYLERAQSIRRKKWAVAACVSVCLGTLFFFKYFNFVSESISAVLSSICIQYDPFLLDILLPVGISFYTFQTLSYVVDVYKGETQAERHFGKYATFVSFFPQLVAGPIERSRNLLPQICTPKPFDYDTAVSGMKQMAWGFFKKLAVADSVAPFVNEVYASPSSYNGFQLTLATVAFAFQIYCDFSAYSDIAIGSAKLFSIKLMRNFNSPYFSTSVKEFWGRWHISLSSWLRDYVYIPLGGNRVTWLRHKLNLMATFLLSGLWHGASWNFVIWGGLHGSALVTESIIRPRRNEHNVAKLIFRWTIVFSFCCLAWIFFRAQDIGDAFYILAHLTDNWGINFHGCKNRLGLEELAAIMAVLAFDFLQRRGNLSAFLRKRNVCVRWICYTAIITCLIHLVSGTDTHSEFIYFQF